jgi:hypothetical protein
MKTRLDAVVAELVRNIDFKICSEIPKGAVPIRKHRMYLLLQMLTRQDAVACEQTAETAPYWRPSRRLAAYSGVAYHGFADDYEEVAAPVVESKITEDFAKHLDKLSGAEVERKVGFIISFFSMFELGLLEYGGKGNDGLCQWRRKAGLEPCLMRLDPVVAANVDLLYQIIFDASEPMMQFIEESENSREVAKVDLVQYLVASGLAVDRWNSSDSIQEIVASERLRRKSQWISRGWTLGDRQAQKHINHLLRNALRYLNRHAGTGKRSPVN